MLALKSVLFSALIGTMSTIVSANRIAHHNGLSVHVYHLAPEPVLYQNSTDLSFSPTAFTLISGHHSAVLVDAPATTGQGQEIIEWIAKTIPGKSLKYIYVTHGHGDHFFSAGVLQQKYPNAKVIATKGTAEHIAQQYTQPFFDSFWAALFPDKIDTKPISVDVLPEDGIFKLEGHDFRAVSVGQGDTYNSTVLHVPSLDLVVGGDVVYGDCHQLFAEDNTPELRAKWLDSLDKVAALKPKVVVPSHMREDNAYSPDHVDETKEYIRAYEQFLKESKTWQELEGKLKERFPDRDGTFILRWSCQAPFGADF
ncbi:hypothetical protein OHC33_003728 [Knufia fluminis]|uniref:Metallo-beta-lactamase domain-containing protein n=2 Tax=Knufia TaxID=430999 RepID=A0AAN8EG79_9EURO|nr:hypothetical protein OHC33_003728 [Knufia fluminis]